MLKRILDPFGWRPILLAGFITTSLLGQPQPPPEAQLPPVQGQGEAQEEDNRPGRGVARISLINGDVSVKRGDSGDWVAAAPNAPLVGQDRVLTGNPARSEIQLDYGNMVRLASNSELRFAELENNRFMMQLAAGTMTYRFLRDSEAEVEISTPAVAIRPAKRGVYRITLLPDGTTEITVRSGEAEIFTPHGTERLRAGRTMLVRGTAADPEFQVVGAIPRDDWDQWNENRDRELERSTSYRYVSPSISGAEDLDNNGQWNYDPPYGYVWSPRVDPGWAPYRHGRWVWTDFYGWTWVSDDPWGWAPYHYGRWYYGGRGWSWWPGAVRSHHYWSPGLVAFVGFGGGVGVGVGFGNVGWIPLAPYEAYHPWYGWNTYRGYGSRNYVNNVNIVNNVNVTNVYRNARVANGITAVNSADFTNGRVHNTIRVNENDLRQASLVRGQLPVTPGRAALRLSDKEVATSPRSSDQGRFFSRRTASTTGATSHVSFEDQRRGVEELSKRTFGGSTGNGGGRVVDPSSGRVGGGASGGTIQNQDSNNGWRRFGEPRGGSGRTDSGASTSTRSVSPGAGNTNTPGAATRDNTNWRRFGEPGDTGSRPADSGRSTVRTRPADPSTSAPSTDSRSGAGRRFESSPAGGGRSQEATPARAPRMDAPARETPRQSSPPPAREPRQPAERKNNFGAAEPLHVSPPIVRERTAQRSDSGSGRSSNFNGATSVRSASAGGSSYSPPPRPSGGGGGGASRTSSGGGGGSSHSTSGNGSSGAGSHGRR